MDTFDKTLKQLSQQGYLFGYRSLSEQLKDSLALSGISSIKDLTSVHVVDDYREQLSRLASGYGLTKISKDIAEQDLAVRVAMSNSLTNLSGIDSLARKTLASACSLQQQIEDLTSPLSHIRDLFASVQLPARLRSSIPYLDVTGGLIGEFAFSDEPEESEAEQPSEELENGDREEVESRIIQVEYLPQRLFDAIRNEPMLMRGLDPRAFEEFTAELLSKLGFQGIRLTPRSGDGGRDIVATQVVNDIPVIMAFECKQYAESNKIGPDYLRALLGTITQGATRASMGVLVTTSSFTSGARSFIAAEASIDGKDFKALSKWLLMVK